MGESGIDDRDVAGDDFRWLSYGELAQSRGISTASAIRLAFRRKWRRQDGNDGTVRIAVPLDETEPRSEADDSMGDEIGRDIGQVVVLLESAAATLRERGGSADVMLAALHANAEEARARAEAETASEREARKRAESATAAAESRIAQFRDSVEQVRQEAAAERAARADAEAEAARLRQAEQARRDRGLLARLRAALRGE